jgi:hypothetical protein
MDEIDDPPGSEPPARRVEPHELAPPLLTSFFEHLRHGHGVQKVPEDEAEAWQLHQELHGR